VKEIGEEYEFGRVYLEMGSGKTDNQYVGRTCVAFYKKYVA